MDASKYEVTVLKVMSHPEIKKSKKPPGLLPGLHRVFAPIKNKKFEITTHAGNRLAGSAAWKAVVLPLHHVCAGFNGCKHTSLFCSLGKLVTNSPTVGVFLSSGWRRGRAERRHGDQ